MFVPSCLHQNELLSELNWATSHLLQKNKRASASECPLIFLAVWIRCSASSSFLSKVEQTEGTRAPLWKSPTAHFCSNSVARTDHRCFFLAACGDWRTWNGNIERFRHSEACEPWGYVAPVVAAVVTHRRATHLLNLVSVKIYPISRFTKVMW